MITSKCEHLYKCKGFSSVLFLKRAGVNIHTMPRRKDILEKQLLLLINLGGIIRPFTNMLESIILQRERLFSGKHSGQLPIFPGVEGPSKFPPRSDRAMLTNGTKTQKLHLRLQTTVSMLNVKVDDLLVRKGCRRKPLLSKKNMAAQLRFAKLHLNEPQDFWNHVLWTDQTEVEMLRRIAPSLVKSSTNTSYTLSIVVVEG